ncbi:MAG: hypothetical protein J7576_18895, partial [Siphonobacter aquaeclarae]|nr:hypothetical protein [Siphonobacter aquaeclarae]
MNLTDFDALADFGSIYRSAATDKRFYLTGSLASITYPTGGMTKFWFEPHTYSKEVKPVRWEGLDEYTANRIAGGLRIKEIHNYDAVTSKVLKRKFYYISAFNPTAPDTSATALSSGVSGVRSQYYFPLYKPKPEDEGILVEEDIFSSQSRISGTENSLGSHIGYSNVVEWTSAEGWTVHKFTNFDTGYPDGPPSAYIQPSSTPYIPFSDNAFKRGKELEVSRFHKNGNPVSKETYQYALIGNINNAVRGVRAEVLGLCQTDNRVYEATAYQIDIRKFLPYEVTTYLYDQNEPSKYSWQAVITGYKPNGQVREIYTTDSKTLPVKVPLNSPPTDVYNRQNLTEFKYPDDYSDGVYPEMKLRNIIGLPVEVTTRLAVVNSGVFNYTPLNWKKVSYKTVDSTYVPEKVESRHGAAAAATIDIEFLTYDNRGNVLTFKEKTGATTKLEYYGTGDIGKTDLLKSRTDADGTTASSRTSYNYKPLVGVQSVRGPSGKVTWYNYDVFGRLSDIREDTSTGNLIKSFHYNYAGQGGWSNGIVDDPGVDTLSTLGLISVAGCNFNIALSASPANPNTGQSVTLTAACTGTDCNNLTYSWTGQGVTGTASTTTFGAPAAAGSYNYSVSVARTGCNTPKLASLPLPVGPTGEACYVLAPASYPDRRLSNHNGLLKVKAQDGTASQIWELSSQGTGFSKIISKGSTNGAGIGSVLGVAGQGNAEGNPVELQTSATGDHQLWEISAMTGVDQGRDKFVRKGTSLRIGSRFNWGAGSDSLNSPVSDLALASDPNNDFGGNKWIKTSVGCPTGPCTPPAKPVISLATGSGSTVCAATNQKVTLKTNGTGTIKWYKDGVLIAGAAGTTYEVTVAGSYTTTTTSTGTPTCTSTVSDAYNVLQTTGCALSGDDRCIVTQVWLLW